MAHIQSIVIHSLQCHILNILQYGSLSLLYINAYARGKTTGLGKYVQRLATGVVHYLGTGPTKAFFGLVEHFGKGPGIVISLNCTFHTSTIITPIFNPHILLCMVATPRLEFSSFFPFYLSSFLYPFLSTSLLSALSDVELGARCTITEGPTQ